MKLFRAGPLLTIIGGLVSVFLMLPLLSVIPISFTSKRYLSLPNGNWSLKQYTNLFTDPIWADAILVSIKVGLVAASLATILALVFTLGIWMTRPKFAGTMIGVALLPMMAPPVVSALTLYFFLKDLSDVNSLVGYDTWLGVALAHTVMVVPYAVVIIFVALSSFDRKIDMAARSMGASVFTRMSQVIIPNIKFGIAGAFLLSFVLSWDEIGVTLFVSSVNAITLPRRMWMGLRDNVDPTVAALSVVIITIVSILIILRALHTNFGNRNTQ
jgi:putative spermidine/putrescine transport system permease protein